MASFNIDVRCDLNKPVTVRHLDGMVFSQDVHANRIRVSGYRDGEPVDLSGGSVSANIIRADGATVVQTGTISNNVCSVVLPSSAYAVPGPIAIFVKHSTSAGPTTSTIAAITGYVYKSTTDTIVDPGSVVPNVNQLLAMIEDCEEATAACIAATAAAPVIDDTAGAGDTNKVWSADKAAGENSERMAGIAPTYSSSATYAVGAYVHHNGHLYRCTTAIPSGEAWNSAHWTLAAIGTDLKNVKNQLESTINVHAADGNKGIETFDIYSKFEHFGLNTDGSYMQTQKYRVSCEGHISFGRDIVVNVKTGFRWGYIPFSQGAAGSWSGWKTSEYTIPSGTEFVVQIARATENTSEIADVLEFVSAVTFRTEMDDRITALKSDADYMLPFFSKNITFVDGKNVYSNNGTIHDSDTYSYAELRVAMLAGSVFTGHSNASPSSNNGLAFYDEQGNYISGFNNTVAGSYNWEINGTIPENAFLVRISCRTAYKSEFYLRYSWNKANENIENAIAKLNDTENRVDVLESKMQNITIPELRNGSAGNVGNANSVSTLYIYPIDFTKDSIHIEYTGDASLADEYYWAYCKFLGATDGMTSQAAYADSSITKTTYNAAQTDFVTPNPFYDLPTANLVGYDHIMFFLFRKKNGSFVPLRIATDQYSFRMSYKDGSEVQSYRNTDAAETVHDLLHAKHAKGNTGARLTLLHFSDLHKDTSALARIMKEAKGFTYDDAICTGDMVSNTYEQISSWWDESVLTCIGNHDSASYSSSTGYNWTALSMANRSAYYIEPFESGWGITHTSGTSYYYKDYSDAKVRLIVMDAMLYSSGGAEATAQTSWLEGLLESAITNNLHVLIAIHAPHGGAMAKDCSFSRYGQGTMPTYQDCNTPQDVIDAVAEKISGGLKFAGYIVGHTHQDNIWDAEGDGTQLMYCITCAAVSNADQWKQSDQHRDDQNDAYNIVTIDTANTLVKIIRGGGANMDDHMRTRKAICFNYSTGEMVGEVL